MIEGKFLFVRHKSRQPHSLNEGQSLTGLVTVCAIAVGQVNITCYPHGLIQFCRNQPQQIEAQVLQWVMKGQSHEQEG